MTSELPAHLRAYQETLYNALEQNDVRAVRDASPLDQLSRLAELALPVVDDEASAKATLLALGAVGSWATVPEAMQAADELFVTSERFAESIYLAYSLTRDSSAGLRLVRARRYLEDALVPEVMADLTTDRYALLKTASFTQVWPEAKYEAALGSIEGWRRHYVAAYNPAHEQHRKALGVVADTVDEMTLRAEAIERLNTLRRLGAPVAQASLHQFHELERLYACSIDTQVLNQALISDSVCPECRFVLGASAPTLEARRVRQSIDRGLLSQQRRLSQRVIMRLLAQGQVTEEDRLARFIEVVRASDLNGLALVLDDELIDFLRRLLDPPAPTDLLERLASTFPEVTVTNLDDVVTEVRRLLTADLVQAGGVLRIRSRRL